MEPNHLIHGIVSLLLCWPWLLVWLFLIATNDPNWRCQTCGHKVKGPANTDGKIIAVFGGIVAAIVVLSISVFVIYNALVPTSTIETTPTTKAVTTKKR